MTLWLMMTTFFKLFVCRLAKHQRFLLNACGECFSVSLIVDATLDSVFPVYELQFQNPEVSVVVNAVIMLLGPV